MIIDAQYFAGLFATSDDPWAFRTRWYERRKRDLIMASLPRQFHERAFEPACANGYLHIFEGLSGDRIKAASCLS